MALTGLGVNAEEYENDEEAEGGFEGTDAEVAPGARVVKSGAGEGWDEEVKGEAEVGVVKKLKFRRVRPSALPEEADLVDYVEWGLQWVVSWLVIDIEGHPCVGGFLSGVLLMVPVWGIVWVVLVLSGHWR